jgi:DNA-binding LacI/PurR family transcriptional regulator
MDVSSVSKILNRTPGSVFRPETIRRVFSAARELGYDFNRGRAGMAKNALKEILTGGHLVRMSAAKIKVYRKIAGL